VSNVGSDLVTLQGLLDSFTKGEVGPELLEGMITDGYMPSPTETTDPWIKLFTKVHDQYIPDLPFDGNVLYGMAQAYNFVQLMKAAGRNPTRDGLVETLETTELTGGPGLAPFGYSDTNHLGYTGVRVVQVEGGTVNPLTPVQVSSDTGSISPFEDPPSEPPATGIP